MRIEDLGDLLGKEALRAITFAAAIGDILKDEPPAIVGAAIGIALGKWVATLTPDVAKQEQALDKVLVLTAHATRNYDAK
jgi:hypothetical protein